MYVRMFPHTEDWGWRMIGALPAAQIADGVDVRVLLRFPDIRRGIPDAHVVLSAAILSQVDIAAVRAL